MATITVSEPVRALLEHALSRFIGGPQPTANFLLTVARHTFNAGELADAFDAVAKARHNGLRPFLDLSTGHLRPSTRKLWEESFDAEHFPVRALVGETGWMLWVPSDNDQWDYRCGSEVPAIFDYARAIGADYLMFDADAPDIEGLAYFEDDDEGGGCPAASAECASVEACPGACEGRPSAPVPFDFTAEHDAYIQALSAQRFEAHDIARLLGRRVGVTCSRTAVAARLAELATAEAAHG